jgi:hypothetical protein
VARHLVIGQGELARLAGAAWPRFGGPGRALVSLLPARLWPAPLLVANAALTGPEIRFRYPLDPPSATLAA